MTPPLAVIDVETTGLHLERRVWEVAIIRRDPGAPDRELVLQVADVDLSAADPKGLQIGGFYDRHHQYAPPTRIVMGFDGGTDTDPSAFTLRPSDVMVVPEGKEGRTYNPPLDPEVEVARQVEQWTRGAHLIGVNPAFDAATLDPMLRRHGLIPAWHYHVVDVSAMALGWMHGQGWGRCSCGAEAAGEVGHPTDADCKKFYPSPDIPWRSDDLSRACGVEPPADDERHTALGDARWALRLYDHLTGATPA